MKKVSICSVLFFISCLFQLPLIYAQESQIVNKNSITVEFKLVCDGKSDSCGKALLASTGEELYVQKNTILSLEDVNFAEVHNEEAPQEILDALNTTGLKTDSKSVSLRLKLNDHGKEKLSEATSQNIGKRMAIFIDGDLVSAPEIHEPISDGELAFSSSLDLDRVKSIAERINQAQEFNKKN